ncbi:hypothetical protein BGZ98_001711 [Dissophora globulifera]|nr:hypothetical protein BGZ98_001711 [Dissophora globulifera]
MMTGYIEAIEARLHRMEGLLGGLVKDKDPRAEIVRAELDAMAREAEMTGLKLRRSKAYEEINHAMASSSTSSASSSKAPSSTSAPAPPLLASRGPSQQTSQQQSSQQPPHSQHTQQQQQQYQQQQQQQHRPSITAGHMSSSRNPPQQSSSGYRPHGNTSILSDAGTLHGSAPPRSQPLIQPSPVPSASWDQYRSYDQTRHSQPSPESHQRQQQPQPRHRVQSSHGSSHPYPTQQHSLTPQHSQSQRERQAPSHYSPYGDSGFSAPRQRSTHDGSRDQLSHSRSSSHTGQSHLPTTPMRDRDHHRNGSGHNSNGNGSSLSTGHRPSYSTSSNSGFLMDSHRIVTHRPSLTAHQLSNPLTGYMHIPETFGKDDTLIMPSLDVINHLLDVYFRSIHPVLPMLHPRTIFDQIHRNESPPSHLLFAILGLASRFSENTAFRVPQVGIERPPCAIFYERAKHFIKDEYDNSQLATVQTLLLMAVQQMGFCESQRAWLCVGMAIRMAQDLGLNKEPSEQEQTVNRLQCEMRKRTWWSLFVVERLVCAGLGRPLTITHKDCEAGFPQQEDDDGDLSSRSLSTRPLVIDNFIHLIKLSKIQGDILEFIKAKFSPPSKTAINPMCGKRHRDGSDQDRDSKVDASSAGFATLDKALKEWRQNLPECLQNPTTKSPQFGLFLHLTFNTLIILLHRPEVQTSQASASLCTQAAASISDITEILMDAKTLTSMFISGLYAIFSAGIIHFMNIPSNKSSTSSPVILGSRGPQCSHTLSAKTNLKRCIDALKFLASHWVSAGRRAKVLEDLLDLKHVSLKDLEVDPFKTVPVGPSWALETTRYKEALIGSQEGQDKLRQQCRSKVMAIHSLLANDDEFRKMQRRRSSTYEAQSVDDYDSDGRNDNGTDDDKDTTIEYGRTDLLVDTDTTMTPAAKSDTSSPVLSRPTVGLGLHSPTSSAPSVSSPASVRTDMSGSQHPLESDPVILVSTAKLGISDRPVQITSEKSLVEAKAEKGVETAAGPGPQESGLLTPMTITTLAQDVVSPLPGSGGGAAGSRNNSSGSIAGEISKPSKQEAMLDPFSMPRSLSFPDRDGQTQSADGSNGSNVRSSSLNTVWTTDSVTQRTTARSEASSPIIPSGSSVQEASQARKASTSSSGTASPSSLPSSLMAQHQPLSHYNESSRLGSGSGPVEIEEQDLVWNDMPPTLGLDEWTAYIGAMMMRWLYASGQSPPGSAASL